MTEEKKGLFKSLFGKKDAEADASTVVVENEKNGNNNNGKNPIKREAREVLEITPAVVDNARLTLLDILKTMSFTVDVVSKENALDLEGINLEIIGEEDLGLVIGKDGNTLNSLQFLLSRILSNKYQKRVYVHLDANAYKEKKLNTIIAAAEDAADVAENEGVQIALDPMNAAERRIVHMTLQKRDTVETFSRGEGTLRHIIVAKKGSAIK
ncbi:KH domain-containing protein [bacterium]|nr:KH domain-containing protein [bacterium]